jgi:DamX protein
VLFDPEQSLAVSLVNLIKTSPQKISIAIEHGQNLSIQILHELTQLAEIAKRAQLTINVLVSGNYVLGHKLSENSILFKNKLSIIAAESGQLVPLKSPLFKQKRQWFNSLKKAKWLIISLVTILFLALAGVVVVERLYETKLKVKTQVTNQPSAPVFVAANKLKTADAASAPATHSDILNALSLSEAPEIQLADNNDVLSALTLAESIQPIQTITSANKMPSKLADEVLLIEQHEAKDVINIYQSMTNGFVIQFAAFSEQKVKNDFLKQYSNLEYASYFRLIDGVEFEVLTSVPYGTRLEVEQAKASLPESLQALKIWIKSLDAIKSEIKHYQSSQS